MKMIDTLLIKFASYNKEGAALLEKYKNRPLGDYAAALWNYNPGRDSQSPITKLSFDLFISQLTEEMNTFLSKEESERAVREFIENPVLQTGPHFQLLADYWTFYTVLFSAMGVLLSNRKYVFMFGCTTNTLETMTKYGPGWLKFSETDYNIFGLPRKDLKTKSMCAYPGPVRFCFTTSGDIKNTPAEEHLLNSLLPLRSTVEPAGIIPAIHRANGYLWKLWDKKELTRPVVLTDTFIKKLLVRHLRESKGFINRVLFDKRKREKISRRFRVEKEMETGAFISNNTDFFWGIRKGRIRPLRITGDSLCETGVTGGLVIPFTPGKVVQALNGGLITPNLFLVLLMLSLLTGIRVPGGLKQIGYYPVFKRILMAALDESKDDEKRLMEELTRFDYCQWGMHVLLEPLPPADALFGLKQGSQVESLIEKYAALSLTDATRDFRIFRAHPVWESLLFNDSDPGSPKKSLYENILGGNYGNVESNIDGRFKK